MTYQIPSMKEINEAPKSHYKAVSLFAGCGGSSTGYKMAGFNVLLSSEFIPAAVETYKANHPNTIVLDKDIRDTTGQEILDQIGLTVGELDLLDGSPPCASFSTAGIQEKGWGKVKKYSDTKQRVDDLFFEYVRIVNDIRPKVIVAENVQGLTHKVAKPVLDEILAKLGEHYHVDYRVLYAKHLGVPQTRPRTIIIGVRKDLGMDPVFPVEDRENIVTVGDAFGGLEIDQAERQMLLDTMARARKGVLLDVIRRLPVDPDKSVDGSYAFNGERKMFSLIRCSYRQPANTIVEKGSDLLLGCGLVHPTEPRKLTIKELKRLQSLPDDFILTGDYAKQYERIARSVPPLMMKRIAETIKTEILDKVTAEKEAVAVYQEAAPTRYEQLSLFDDMPVQKKKTKRPPRKGGQ